MKTQDGKVERWPGKQTFCRDPHDAPMGIAH
jgi:hypothetical protein